VGYGRVGIAMYLAFDLCGDEVAFIRRAIETPPPPKKASETIALGPREKTTAPCRFQLAYPIPSRYSLYMN